VDILEVHSNDEEDTSPILGESATNEILTRVENQREQLTTAGGKSRLVIPSSFFKKPRYHPLEIFVRCFLLSKPYVISNYFIQ
jgi:hypothetical protein